MRDEKRFAVLIDADNVSAKYIKSILDEISNYGIITYKRIYTDWTKPTSASWKDVLLNNSITPVQQYSYTTGKNATDSAMIIDAMDILYSNNVDGFCIVSSDSDFTKLATRLRESGMTVIGMGEEKTPKPFSAACNIFKYLDILVEDDNKAADIDVLDKGNNNSIEVQSSLVKDDKNMTDISIIESAMIKIITEHGDDEKGIDAGELGSRLVKRYTEFDVRNYGYTKLSKFLASFNSIGLSIDGNHIKVFVKNNNVTVDIIQSAIIQLIEETTDKCINMGKLNQCLIDRFPTFNVRNYGYTKFSQFIKDLNCLKVESRGPNRSIKFVLVKNKIENKEISK